MEQVPQWLAPLLISTAISVATLLLSLGQYRQTASRDVVDTTMKFASETREYAESLERRIQALRAQVDAETKEKHDCRRHLEATQAELRQLSAKIDVLSFQMEKQSK